MCRVYKLRTGAEPFPHPNLPGADLLCLLPTRIALPPTFWSQHEHTG